MTQVSGFVCLAPASVGEYNMRTLRGSLFYKTHFPIQCKGEMLRPAGREMAWAA